jgi:antitoxin VapB
MKFAFRIRPVSRSLEGVLKKFASFSPDFMANGREQEEQTEREGL